MAPPLTVRLPHSCLLALHDRSTNKQTKRQKANTELILHVFKLDRSKPAVVLVHPSIEIHLFDTASQAAYGARSLAW